MKNFLAVLIVLLPLVLHAGIEGPLIKLGVKQLMTILTKDQADSKDALNRLGGEKGVEALLETSFDQGGTALVSRVVYYGENYGGDALTVISPAPKDMVAALDDLDTQGQALAIRNAARDPMEMSELVQEHGGDVLTLSIQHPGMVSTMVQSLGKHAFAVGPRLTTDDIMVLVSFSEAVKNLHNEQQAKFFQLLESYPADLVIALKVRPDILMSGHFENPIMDLRRLIEEGIPLPQIARNGSTTLDFLVGNFPLMILVLAGALLVSWGVSGLVPSAPS